MAQGLYTALTVCLNIIADGGGSNLYAPELEAMFTPKEVEDRIYGSKIVVISEQAMLNVIYTIKACMLLMYTRLTLGLRDSRLVRYLAIYVAVGWFVTELTFFLACRPFSHYWALPPPDPQCTTLENYAIVQGIFNISADLLMLCIPIPLIVRMKLPWRQKIVLVFIFSLGVFVVLAALMTKIFNLTDVYNPNYMLWYIREASVAVYVSNLPMIWPLLRDWFPGLKYLSPGLGGTRKRCGRSRSYGNGAAGSAHYTSKSATPMKISSSTTMSTRQGGGGRFPNSTHESILAGIKRKGSMVHDDIEMAMAAHGLSMDNVVESDEEELKPRSYSRAGTSRSRSSTRRSSGPGWSVRVHSPAMMMRADGQPEALDKSLKLAKTDLEAREKALSGGIQVRTVVEITEEMAPEPVLSRAQSGRGRAPPVW